MQHAILLDKLPEINEKTCQVRMKPEAQAFALNGGEETFLDIKQGAGTINAGIHIPADATFQLYAPMCVYYSEEDGSQHGTCTTYRLIDNRSAGFKCSETPINGTFEQTFFGYCEN
ncbi:MAG: hypothetical protein WAU73_20920 [Candidatus Sulfotelmatobacter sp.]|jgi:hypothetical protein